ncbi:MAG: GNAT family N-acetyltransferase [Coriobacteriia bacterium]|nr:GNAT family N-acetyltransferase [Actinomycetota bacterium]MDZ4166897.1 GNAT family N-acetyltransferase [Coriobacteriia bacterium]
MTEGITITRAAVSDAHEILGLIRRAFASAARLYDEPDLPPLAESIDEHEARYATHVVLKAVDPDGRIVGSVQGERRADGTCYVARLAVEPSRQRQGIGLALTAAIEAEFPEAQRFELFTGHLNESSLRLYASLGYRETRRRRESDRLTLVWLEKVR